MLDTRAPGERGTLVFGAALILIGGIALLGQAVSFDVLGTGWPLLIVIPGILLFAGAVAVGGKAGVALAIPGSILAMVGLILAVQSATGLWATWAYAWALVAPGGVGIGLVLYGLVTGQREFVRAGTPVLMISLGLFFGFGLFFEGVLGLSGRSFLGAKPVLAIGLVAIGVILLISGAVRRRAPTA